MKKKRAANKKKPQKKPVLTNDNTNGLANFVEQIAHKISEPGNLKDDKFGESGPELESGSESPSSSSTSGEHFASSDLSTIYKRVENWATKRGRGRPRKGDMSEKATDMRAKSSMELNPLSSTRTQSNKMHHHPQYNKKELMDSLAVIKKVMEMDEAIPFNTPTDPTSLGIPDYFDVIDTPMDFGTICSNLQTGVKYLNAEDVYKDVQYIWQNCLKVNKKGDYTVYLMKRVKKKFIKYWTSAGLRSDILMENTDNYTRNERDKETLIRNSMASNPIQMQKDNYNQVQKDGYSQLPKDNYSHVQKDNYGITQPHSQVPLSSPSLPYQSNQPQPNTSPLAQFSQLQTGLDNNFAGLAHLVAYIDHAIRHTRHEATLVENSVGNPPLTQKDNFGTSQLHSQVPLSSYGQPHPTHLPQPSTTQAPQFSRLQDDTDSNYAGHSNSKNFGLKRKKDAIRDEISPLMSSKRQRPQQNSYLLWQSQQNTSQLQPSHFGTADIDNTDCDMTHNGYVPRHSVDPMDISPSQCQAEQHPLNHGQQDRLAQPPACARQLRARRSHPMTTADTSTAGHSPLPTVNHDRKLGRRHARQSSTDLEAEIPCVPDHAPPQQPSGSDDQQNQSHQHEKRKKRGRGPTWCRDMWDMIDGVRMFVPVNTLGQPVGPEASKLASFLGTVARNGKMAPLSFPDWHAMPHENKEEMWKLVQAKFDIDIMCKSWVLKSIASKWRNWKARLKAEHYYTHKTDEERLKDCDKRIIPEQWPILVSYWNNEKFQLRCEKNKANRANQKCTHTAGSKSFARLREEERAKRPDGNEPTRADLFIMTRTRKDGHPLNEKAAELISKLNEHMTRKPQTSQSSNEWEDAFGKVMGVEKPGQVRMYGLGPTPRDIWGQKPSRVHLMQMAYEAKRSAKEEVSKMVEKMEAMEQKYASMEAQIAKMTSSMQNFLDKMSVPCNVPSTKQVPINLDPHEDSAQEQVRSSSSIRGIQFNEVDYQEP